MSKFFWISLWIPCLLVGIPLSASAQPSLEPSSSRQMTEAEWQTITSLWKTDPPLLEPILEQSFAVNLQGYGSIFFLSLFDSSSPGQPQTLTHWLVDGGRVRWELPMSEELTPLSYTPFSLDAVVFTELDFDGLTDIYTIASYITGIGATGAIPFPVVTLYQQQEDGSFLILQEVSLALTERGVATVAEAEEILRKEMLFLP
ncbi:MAG: hypothetical protein NW237_02625 [Cyanobacteriota bacterium]|nr:hypothetical protein [Cyanobacteriota bacterium]